MNPGNEIVLGGNIGWYEERPFVRVILRFGLVNGLSTTQFILLYPNEEPVAIDFLLVKLNAGQVCDIRVIGDGYECPE